MINVATEGESDREAALAVVRCAGRTVGKVRVAGGKTKLDPLIPKYNAAALREPWVVFRDSDGACPVTLRANLFPQTSAASPRFALRIAHSMTEVWLMADREKFAEYFRISAARVPDNPEDVPHGKRTLLELVLRSRSKEIREDVVTPSGQTGPLYVSRINDFASTVWRPEVAASASDSLRRAIGRIAAL